jgi:hypothetical protein
MRTTHDLPTRLLGTTGLPITRVGFGPSRAPRQQREAA